MNWNPAIDWLIEQTLILTIVYVLTRVRLLGQLAFLTLWGAVLLLIDQTARDRCRA